MLHGNERRKMHEDMRRRMMERVAPVMEQALDYPEQQREVVGTDDNEDEDDDHTPVRSSRRRRHNSSLRIEGEEEQTNASLTIERQQMSLHSSTPTTTTALISIRKSISTIRTCYSILLTTTLRRGRHFTQQMLRCASNALETMPPLPHGSNSLDLIVEEAEEEEEEDGGRRINIDFYTGLVTWILRLNLALFYINGYYPTILHRLTRLRIHNNHNHNLSPTTTTTTNDNQNRPSYTIVGKILLLQSIANGIHTLSRLVVHSWTMRQARQIQYRRRERDRAQRDDEAAHDWIDTRVPSLKQHSSTNTTTTTPSPVVIIHDTNTPNIPPPPLPSIQCSICMNNRTHPATLITCGHVFCWGCVHHWISMVRMECPICRSVTRPQDVLPLYHYVAS